MVDDLEQLISELELSKPVIIGGSYGAMVALSYAIKYPNSLSKLLLIAGSASGQFIQKANENLKKIGDEEQIEIGEKLLAGKISSQKELNECYERLWPLYLGKHSNMDISNNKPVPPTIASKIEYPLHILNYGFSNFLRKFDFTAELHRIKVPTLVLYNYPQNLDHMLR